MSAQVQRLAELVVLLVAATPMLLALWLISQG